MIKKSPAAAMVKNIPNTNKAGLPIKIAKTEGIIMALESSHALVEAIKQAPKMSQDEIIVVNISGRGDNYLFNIARGLEDQEFVEFCRGVAG